MNNEEISEILCAIHDMTPIHLHNFLENALTQENFDFEKGGLLLTGELNTNTMTVNTSAINRQDGLWIRIKREVHDYICTDSTTYKAERAEAGSSLKSIISILATALATKFHIAMGIITGIVTLIIISMIKISKNAWCKLYTEEEIRKLQ